MRHWSFQKELSELIESYPDSEYVLAPGGAARAKLCSRQVYDLSKIALALATMTGNLSDDFTSAGDISGIGDILRDCSERLTAIKEELDKVCEEEPERKVALRAHIDRGHANGYKDHMDHCDALRAVGKSGSTQLAQKYLQEIESAIKGTIFENPKGIESVADYLVQARIARTPGSAEEAVSKLLDGIAAKKAAGIDEEVDS
jgi:hypothetical protein